MNKIIRFFGVFLFCMLAIGIWSIAEDITLTTYYPAPYGAYDAMYTTTLGIGDNNGNSILGDNGDAPTPATDPGEVWVAGNVGIGTTGPNNRLDVRFDTSAGAPFVSDGAWTIFASGGNTKHGILGQSDGVGQWGGVFYNSVNGHEVDIAGPLYAAVFKTGNVGIGTLTPNYKLDVAGDIHTTGDVIGKTSLVYTYPDYVFEPAYLLMPLTELRNFVMEHKHLPRMPSKEDIANSGVAIFEQNRLILEKLEEAYLYIFELEKRIEKLERR